MNNLKKIISIIIILSVTSINTKAEINDSIFATVGNKVITRSDIVNEIKIILISTGQQFSTDKLKPLQAVAVHRGRSRLGVTERQLLAQAGPRPAAVAGIPAAVVDTCSAVGR